MVEFVNPGWPQTITGGPQSYLTIAGTHGISNGEAVSISLESRKFQAMEIQTRAKSFEGSYGRKDQA
jgi:hypothetical protein